MFTFFLRASSFPNRFQMIRLIIPSEEIRFLFLSLSDMTQKRNKVIPQNSIRRSISDGSKESWWTKTVVPSRKFDSRLTNDLRNLLCPNRCKRKYARPRLKQAWPHPTYITRETEIRTSNASTTINFNRIFAYARARKYT